MQALHLRLHRLVTSKYKFRGRRSFALSAAMNRLPVLINFHARFSYLPLTMVVQILPVLIGLAADDNCPLSLMRLPLNIGQNSSGCSKWFANFCRAAHPPPQFWTCSQSKQN